MTRKQFIESHGATCSNWQWSWSFVNHAKRFVIFGAWDRDTSGKETLILGNDWQSRRGRRNPGYGQSREHIRLVEEEGYTLKTFPMEYSDSKAGPDGSGPAKIGGFTAALTERKLKQVGNSWFAVDFATAIAEPQVQVSGGGFADPETRRAVEKAAIDFVKQTLEKRGFRVDDHQQKKCGYDLLAVSNAGSFLIEVKGTDSFVPRFFLTRNEYRCSEQSEWRLFVVCEARSTPSLQEFTGEEMHRTFALESLMWECTPRKSVV